MRCTWPEPWQMSQLTGWVPGWQHEPSQVSQSTAVSTSRSRCVPKTTSLRSRVTRTKASCPRSRRDLGRAFRAPPPPKNVSKMSPNPPKPAPPPPPNGDPSPPRS